ncbi:MAG: hypothetical protein JRH15_01455 [Deltaproteobacteria bacterium]|nr:hypothetical protein [Deltaproteobacteria bacterium]
MNWKYAVCPIRCIALFLMLGIYPAGTVSAAAPAKFDFIQKTQNGTINWTLGVLVASGTGTPPERLYDNPQGRSIALREATEVAREHLLILAQQVRIDSSTSLKAVADKNDAILTEIKNMVKGAKTIHQAYFTDGLVTVTLQMDMYGGFSQLALPAKIKQIASVKPIDPATARYREDGVGSGVSRIDESTPRYSGLVVDARGVGLMPSLVSEIWDENGSEVFGSAFASREFAVQYGMVRYVTDLKAAMQHPRVALKPLIVKGLKSGESCCTRTVISNSDAAKIRGAVENLMFLRKCRVIIVLNQEN